MITEEYTHRIIACAMTVHNELGPGLLEKIYQLALAYELRQNGFEVAVEVPVPVVYKGVVLSNDSRIDILVDNQVVIELKSVENMNPLYAKQTLTYLKLMNLSLGYVMNFNVVRLKEGIERVVNKFKE